MRANSFMNAKTAKKYLSQNRVTVVFIVVMEQ
jgi:hypothetical protein